MGLRSCRAAVHTHGSPSFTPQPRGEVAGWAQSFVGSALVALMNRADAVYCFGGFELQPRERRLLCEARPVPLPGKAFDLLVPGLAGAAAGQKDELLTVVWPDTVVEETNLNYTISLIRKALLDGRGGQRYIETVRDRVPDSWPTSKPWTTSAHRGQRSTR